MKTRINLSAFLILSGIFCCGSVFAQEDRLQELDSFNKESRQENNTELLLEGESKISKPVLVSRDTAQVKATPKKTDKPKTEDTSVLSFNFLYYLIERFKLSDIVD